VLRFGFRAALERRSAAVWTCWRRTLWDAGNGGTLTRYYSAVTISRGSRHFWRLSSHCLLGHLFTASLPPSAGAVCWRLLGDSRAGRRQQRILSRWRTWLRACALAAYAGCVTPKKAVLACLKNIRRQHTSMWHCLNLLAANRLQHSLHMVKRSARHATSRMFRWRARAALCCTW